MEELLKIINASFDSGKVLSSAEVGKIHELVKNNSAQIKIFEKRIEYLDDESDFCIQENHALQSSNKELKEEISELEQSNNFPTATFEDENKNKILASLNKNLTLLQLDNVEALVKKMIKEQGKQYVEKTF